MKKVLFIFLIGISLISCKKADVPNPKHKDVIGEEMVAQYSNKN
jgi:hypothetical protein